MNKNKNINVSIDCWPSDGRRPTHRQRHLVANSIPNPTLPHDPGNLCRTDKSRCLRVSFCPSLQQPIDMDEVRKKNLYCFIL